MLAVNRLHQVGVACVAVQSTVDVLLILNAFDSSIVLDLSDEVAAGLRPVYLWAVVAHSIYADIAGSCNPVGLPLIEFFPLQICHILLDLQIVGISRKAPTLPA